MARKFSRPTKSRIGAPQFDTLSSEASSLMRSARYIPSRPAPMPPSDKPTSESPAKTRYKYNIFPTSITPSQSAAKTEHETQATHSKRIPNWPPATPICRTRGLKSQATLPTTLQSTSQYAPQPKQSIQRQKPLRIPIPILPHESPAKPSSPWWESFFDEYLDSPKATSNSARRTKSRRSPLSSKSPNTSLGGERRSPRLAGTSNAGIRKSPRLMTCQKPGRMGIATGQSKKSQGPAPFKNASKSPGIQTYMRLEKKERSKSEMSLDSIVNFKTVMDIKRLGEAVDEVLPVRRVGNRGIAAAFGRMIIDGKAKLRK